MIISRKAIKGILAAVAAAERYKTSYPFWSSWKDPVLQTGLETVIDVTLTAIDAEGAVAMCWFAKDPLIPLKAAVKRDSMAKLRITAECDARHLGMSEVFREFTVEMLTDHHERMGEIVDALAYTALKEAYALHPQGSAFLDEAAQRFGWDAERPAGTMQWLKQLEQEANGGHQATADPPVAESPPPAERKQLELA